MREKEIDWDQLRYEYFKECVVTRSLPKIDMAPHDLFEWFKNKLEMRKIKHLSEDKTLITSKNTAFEKECGANWQLFTNGAIGHLKCRTCGVYVVSGGTPKCLKK